MVIITDDQSTHDTKDLPFYHKLLTNWLLTDPSYVVQQEGQSLRNYQIQKYTQVYYFFGGRLRCTKLKPLNVIVGAVLVTAGILYWVYEAEWTWFHVSPAVVIIFSYLWLLTFAFFVKASASDPGTLPVNSHIPYGPQYLATTNGPDEYFNTITMPYKSDRVNGVNVKYCSTCHIWRVPRLSHCSICGTCVLSHDHHCIFLNNCVGVRNYRHFLWFLLTVTILSVYLAAFSFAHCYYYKHQSGTITSFLQSIAQFPATFFLGLLGCVSAVYPLMLLVFHIFLTANGYSTREYLNYVRPSVESSLPYVNVYSKSSSWGNLWMNWFAIRANLPLFNSRQSVPQGTISQSQLPPLRSFEKAK